MLEDQELGEAKYAVQRWIDDAADVLEGLKAASEDAERSVEGTPLARAVVRDLRVRINAAIREIVERTNTLTVEMAKFQA